MTNSTQITYPTQAQSWGIAGIVILSMIVFSPLSLLLDDFIGKEFSFFLYYVLATGVAFWIAHNQRLKTTGTSEYVFDLSNIKVIALVSVATIALQIGIISPIVSLIPIPDFVRQIFIELSKRNGMFSFLAIVIAAPILEELIFRGVMLDGLLKKYSPVKAILLSSVLFGIVHLNPWQFVGALLAGCLSGWIYYRTKNLALSIVIHFANNCLAFVSALFIDVEKTFDMSMSEFFGGVLNFVMITVGAITLFVACVYYLNMLLDEMKPVVVEEIEPIE